MSKVIAIAKQLKDMYSVRAGINILLDHLSSDLSARQQAITPAAGWLADQPKATVDQRKQAQELAFANDETCRKIRAQQQEARDDLADITADIDGMEVMFQAKRWQIRDRLATALGAPPLEDEEEQDGGFTLAQDTAVDSAVEAAAEAKLPEATPVDDLHSVNDPIPF